MHIEITKEKPVEELVEILKPYSSISIIVCDYCPRITATGGEKRVKRLEEELKGKGIQVDSTTSIPMACVSKNLDSIRGIDSDAVLVVACGLGVQLVGRAVKIPVVPALNTIGSGVEEKGKAELLCNSCGECVLHLTGGICPRVNCPKFLVHGPCGGVSEGMCEVKEQGVCGWIRIYNSQKRFLNIRNKTTAKKEKEAP